MSSQKSATPWRPTLGYENLEHRPLPKQHTTNVLIDPCYTPMGMATSPLRFTNLVSGFNRNPAHAVQTVIFTRPSSLNWTLAKLKLYNEGDTAYYEKFRSGIAKEVREIDDKASNAQKNTGKKIGQRIADITAVKDELRREMELLLIETNLMKNQQSSVRKAIDDIDGTLTIAEECLYARENRRGIDLVHDIAEQSLLKEIDLYRTKKEELRALFGKIQEQQRLNRLTQFELETDVSSKEGAIAIDNVCHRIDNNSKDINYYDAIEKSFITTTNMFSWKENTNRLIQRSRANRLKSERVRTDVANLINKCLSEVWDAWSITNNSLARRVAEAADGKIRLQNQLKKVQQELFEQDRAIEQLRQSIDMKVRPLQVAHTRLQARKCRKNIELCRDYAQDLLIKEVRDLERSLQVLQKKLQKLEEEQQQLLKTRNKLEDDLYIKVNSSFIDRTKCMGLRNFFPIIAAIKY